ncbi:MAG: hypothetical protein Q8N99_06655 [Nanoarchaeota archaeon]|nr:hypothetical protein [Nanoarchaeota archaeon]
MGKYICKQCNFRYETKNPIDCPYCGRKGTLEKEKSACELLDEINNILDE